MRSRRIPAAEDGREAGAETVRGREEGQVPQAAARSPGQGAAGTALPGTPRADVGAGPHLELGRAAAAAAVQVAEPGGGASSPSPGPARGGVTQGGEAALKGAGATGVRTSAWVGLPR